MVTCNLIGRRPQVNGDKQLGRKQSTPHSAHLSAAKRRPVAWARH